MAIDANILLQGRSPDVGNALLKGFQGAETLQMMDIRQQQAQQTQLANQQKLQQQEYLAGILKEGVTASRLKPLIANKDLEGFKKGLAASGLPPEDVDLYSTYADAGRWEQLGQVADQTIQLARDTGVFERDYGAGGGVYTPKDLTLINEYQKALAEAQAGVPGAAERAKLLSTAIENPRYVSGGGGTDVRYNPVTDEAMIVPVTPRPGVIPTGGAGGQMPPNAPPGQAANVNLNEKIDGGSSTSTTASPNAPTVNWGASPEDIIRARDAALAAGKKLGEIEAKKIADLETFDSDFQANKAGLAAQFPEIDLKTAMANAPDTSLTKIATKAWSIFMTNNMAEGEADLESFLQSLAASVPFPPGSQSNAEMDARKARIGEITKSGLTAEKKLKMATRYLEGQEAIATEKKKQAEKFREKYFGKPATPAAGTSNDSVPAGVDPADWAVMTPEEKALWQR